MPSRDWEVNDTGEKLTGTALVLMGVLFMLLAIGFIIFLITVGGLLEALGGMAVYAGVQIPTFTTYLAVGWVYTILQMVTGFVALVAGVAILTKPKESVKTG
jgi:hypothetical protein